MAYYSSLFPKGAIFERNSFALVNFVRLYCVIYYTVRFMASLCMRGNSNNLTKKKIKPKSSKNLNN